MNLCDDTYVICVQIQNILLQLCGLAILVVGILVQVGNQHYSKHLDEITNNLMFPSITLIVIGSIIFIVAFLGCCGAIRESHCMVVTVSSPANFILLYNLRFNSFSFVLYIMSNTSTSNILILKMKIQVYYIFKTHVLGM